MAKRKNYLKDWTAEDFSTIALENGDRSVKELRDAYSQLRSIAQKRIKRLSESEFTYTPIYKRYSKGFESVSNIDLNDLPKATNQVYRFVSMKTSTVRGQNVKKRKTIETMNDMGIKITESNYSKVMQLIEELRFRKASYGSDTLVSAVELTMTKNLDFNNFIQSENIDDYIEHFDVFKKAINTKKFKEMKNKDFDSDDFIEIYNKKLQEYIRDKSEKPKNKKKRK